MRLAVYLGEHPGQTLDTKNALYTLSWEGTVHIDQKTLLYIVPLKTWKRQLDTTVLFLNELLALLLLTRNKVCGGCPSDKGVPVQRI